MDNLHFLETRKKGIGGSDIGGLMGLSQWATPLSIYKQKKGINKELTGDHLYWGHALEQPIINRFIEETGFRVLPQPDVKFKGDYFLANVDALILDKDGNPSGILEIKTASAYSASNWGEDGSQDVPATYYAQVQWYMNVYDVNYAYIAVLIGGQEYRQYYISRNQDFINQAEETADKFWQEHVLADNPPLPTNLAEINDFYKQDNAQSIEANEELLRACNRYKSLKQQAKELAEDCAIEEEIIKNGLGENAQLNFEGEKLCTWKTQTRKALDSKKLKAERPEIYEEYISESMSRVLRVG